MSLTRQPLSAGVSIIMMAHRNPHCQAEYIIGRCAVNVGNLQLSSATSYSHVHEHWCDKTYICSETRRCSSYAIVCFNNLPNWKTLFGKDDIIFEVCQYLFSFCSTPRRLLTMSSFRATEQINRSRQRYKS